MKSIFFCLMILFSVSTAFAQVVIPDEAEIDPTAELKIFSLDKGVLIPRITSSQMSLITSPATGLWVYNTNLKQFFLYDGNKWIPMTQTITATTAPVATDVGECYFNTSDNKLHYWDGTAWITVGTL